MTDPAFVHLRIHSEYSLIDGMVKVKSLTSAVADDQMPAVAVTDQSNLFSVVKFYKAAMAAGVKPIVGADIWLENPDADDKPFRLTCICQNNTGYKNLTCLLSKSYLEGQHLGVPIIKRQWLTEYADGLIVLSGEMAGDVGVALIDNNQDLLAKRLDYYQKIFPNRFYLELHRIGADGEAAYINSAVKLAEQHNLPVVATNYVCFIEQDDFEAHEARVCINQGNVLGDPRRPRNYTEQQYLRSQQEMRELFTDIPEALANTVEIAKRCNVTIKLGEVFLPNFPIPDGLTIEQYFENVSREGLEKRIDLLFDRSADDFAETRKAYDERLDYELGVINKMGFPGYFLIVADFIQWSKENGIPVGPGRGSGAGSLVAYALKITDLDPLTYDLLFERFLNPERVSMPDFDIDFCMDGRDRVIEYVANKYGRESVSQIITYGTMAAKAVVRDVGRVLGHGYGFVDKLAKMIPFELGMTLTKALEQEEDLRKLYKTDDEVQPLIDLALKLEGVVRNAGKHAGGVVIAPSALTDFTPIYCEQGSTSQVSQFDKDDVEAVGLVKFDFLGLRTLTIIDWALQAINAKRATLGEEPIDVLKLELEDKATFDLLKACDTTAVFQLESRGMKDLIKRLQPDCFEEIIALVALFRPGPLQSGMVDDFINRKHGRQKVDYPHPELEPILRSTYGVILYQEQVMQIAQVLANYSLGAADVLRKAMGKKKPEEMERQRDIFVKGAVARDVDEGLATSIFDLMEKFAGYGFNKSHSAAYAFISFQTAWLKAHYPAEFMAAVLSSDMDNTDKVVGFLEDCKASKLEVLPPDINEDDYMFAVNEAGEIRYGMGAIKGVGEPAVRVIVDERTANGPYKDLFDLCCRVDLQKVNRRVLDAMIKSGALDKLGAHRASLAASLDRAIKMADANLKNQQSGQTDMFGMAASSQENPVASYVEVDEWRERERLLGEKEVLGFYLTGHPINRYLPELKHFTTARIAKLRPSGNKTVTVAGLIVAVRTMQTKRGDRMAFIALDDGSGRIEMAVFSDVYQEYKHLLLKDQFVIVEGEVSVDEYSGGYKLSCRSLMDITRAREIHAKCISVKVTQQQAQQGEVDALKRILEPHRGGASLLVVDYMKDNATVKVPLGPEWRVKPNDDLVDDLIDKFGDRVALVYE